MKVVLVDNLTMGVADNPLSLQIRPHLGLLSLQAVAIREGYSCEILDPKLAVMNRKIALSAKLYEDTAKDIEALQPDVVGFTALGSTLLFATRVAACFRRRNPAVPLLLGGPHASILHREILRSFPQFDLVVRHEAENTLGPTLRAISTAHYSGIPGVTWRDGGSVVVNPGSPTVGDLDSLPQVSYNAYPIRELSLDYIDVEAGRGCPFACTFCSTASFFGRRYRLKTPGRIIHEMDRLNREFGFTRFRLNHDMFTINRRKVLAFCREVADRDYCWEVSARTDCVDADLLRRMAETGCRRLYFGIETGSESIQRSTKKKLDLGEVEMIVRTATSLGIRTVTSFITGFPDETEEDQRKTLDMLGNCVRWGGARIHPQLHMLAPEPGTELTHKGYAESQILLDDYSNDHNGLCLDELDWQCVRNHPRLFCTRYHFKTLLPRSRVIFVVEATRWLVSAGSGFLGILLDEFDGSLSKLVRALSEWLLKEKRDIKAVDPDQILAFLEHRFGRHHIPSLYLYIQSRKERSKERSW